MAQSENYHKTLLQADGAVGFVVGAELGRSPLTLPSEVDANCCIATSSRAAKLKIDIEMKHRASAQIIFRREQEVTLL